MEAHHVSCADDDGIFTVNTERRRDYAKELKSSSNEGFTAVRWRKNVRRGKKLSETRQSPHLNETRSHVTLRKFGDTIVQCEVI